ncbi:hypothetical protein NDU88_001708 [Pleurodeles waltl]|uniref:Uncharacterized protein n=1 Tax=Pleurodeles waltl TaxID=8319 RepID=A0AAV7V986_PLEWA|nr:hypothetical protein NDU88_001708 [Pleurodeles waltl]
MVSVISSWRRGGAHRFPNRGLVACEALWCPSAPEKGIAVLFSDARLTGSRWDPLLASLRNRILEAPMPLRVCT